MRTPFESVDFRATMPHVLHARTNLDGACQRQLSTQRTRFSPAGVFRKHSHAAGTGLNPAKKIGKLVWSVIV